MLKYTPEGHPDFDNLNEALEEIKSLADRMNKGEVEADQAEKDIEKLRDIEQTIEGTSDLVSNARKFIRQDLVAESTKGVIKKDRCLFLFSDLLVCTTVKRKNHVLRRNSLFTGQSTPEFNRYKFLWKVNLEDVEVSKGLLLFKFRICFHFFTLSLQYVFKCLILRNFPFLKNLKYQKPPAPKYDYFPF